MDHPDPRVTVEEVAKRPFDETIQVELLDGVVHVSPRPRARHNFVQGALIYELTGPFHRGRGGPGGWWILVEPFVRWGPHDGTGPDLAGWRRERMPGLPEAFPIDVAPDWIGEVLSPSTAIRDRTTKMELYARCGLPHLWILDPTLRTLEAFENRDGRWLRLGAWTDGDMAQVAPFDAVALDVGGLFPPISGPDVVAEGAPGP